MAKWESKEKRVDSIVGAAVEIFPEKGYEGTTIESIAKKAQISKGGLYHHFGGKDEILFFANEKLSETVYGYIQSALEAPNAVEGIKAYIKNYLSYWIDHPKELAFFFLTMTKALACPEMWHIYEDYYNKMNAFMIQLFEKGIREGQLSEHPAKASAILVVSALDGVLTQLVMTKNIGLDEIVQVFEDKFIRSLLKHAK